MSKNNTHISPGGPHAFSQPTNICNLFCLTRTWSHSVQIRFDTKLFMFILRELPYDHTCLKPHVRSPCLASQPVLAQTNWIPLLKNLEHELYRDIISVMFCFPTACVFMFDVAVYHFHNPPLVYSHIFLVSFKNIIIALDIIGNV